MAGKPVKYQTVKFLFEMEKFEDVSLSDFRIMGQKKKNGFGLFMRFQNEYLDFIGLVDFEEIDTREMTIEELIPLKDRAVRVYVSELVSAVRRQLPWFAEPQLNLVEVDLAALLLECRRGR